MNIPYRILPTRTHILTQDKMRLTLIQQSRVGRLLPGDYCDIKMDVLLWQPIQCFDSSILKRNSPPQKFCHLLTLKSFQTRTDQILNCYSQKIVPSAIDLKFSSHLCFCIFKLHASRHVMTGCMSRKSTRHAKILELKWRSDEAYSVT